MTRRVLVVLALLALVVTGAYAQVRGGGRGLTKAGNSNRLSQVPTDQFITLTYPWTSLPASTGAGWYVQQSTASAWTLTAHSPMLAATSPAANNRRVLLWEAGPQIMSGGLNLTGNLESTVAVSIYGMDAVATSTNEWFQLAYGDSTNWIVNKRPICSYGIIVPGTGNANSAYAPSGQITCYVSTGGGGGDTTYVSIGAPATVNKVWIHADPGGGPVQFWIDDVLKATISSPARDANGSSALAFWMNSDATANVTQFLGPVIIQRAWP